VYATGFRALEYLAPMQITGRNGRDLREFWGEEPRAYLGMTMPGFPNLFLMYGPGTNLGYNGNLFFNAECQAQYISECLRWMVTDGIEAMEVKPAVYADYAQRMQEALAQFTWSHPSAGNWYRNRAGKVIANSPWPLIDYWEWTRSPKHDDFIVAKAG
jgi:4-hydroxyacetophenone monooxygenase